MGRAVLATVLARFAAVTPALGAMIIVPEAEV
jgi:hypothetical protein